MATCPKASEPCCNLDALLARERAILGAAILDSSGRQAGLLCTSMAESDFTSSLYRAVFRAIASLVDRNELPLEYVSVCGEMFNQGTFQSFENGYTLVSSLGEGVVLATPMHRRVELLKRASAAYKGKAALGA
jgi:replicative DNA helicase